MSHKFTVLLAVLALAAPARAQWLEAKITLPDSLGYIRNPGPMVENPLTGRLYVSAGSGVMVVDATTGEKIRNFRSLGNPVYFAGIERICVFRGDSLLVIDARADTVITGCGLASYQEATYSTVSNRLYLYDTHSYPADVQVFDVATGMLVNSVEFAGWFHTAVWDSVSNRVFFSAGEDSSGVLVYDCATDSFIGRVWYDWHEGGHIALDPDLRKLYLSRGTGDTIIIIDPDAIAEVSRVLAPEVDAFELVERKTHRLFYERDTATVIFDCRGDSVLSVLENVEPRWLDWDRSTGEVYVALNKQAGVAVIDTNNNICRWLMVERGDTIVSLALKGDATTLYAALAEDTLFLVDPQGGTIQATVVAPYLTIGGLLHNPAGNVLYAFCYNKNMIVALDADGHPIRYTEGLQFGNDLSAILNPVLNRLYVAGDSMLGVVDCNTMQVIHTEALPHFDETSMLLLPERGKLYLFPRNFIDTLGHNLKVFDCWSNSVVAEVELPAEVPHAVYHPGSGFIYFCCRDTPSVRVLDPVTNTVVRTLNVSGTHADDRMEVDLERNRVYYSATRGDLLLVIDALAGTVLDTVDLPRDVDTLVMNHEQNKLYMLRFASTGRFYVYDCVGDTLLPERDFDPYSVALLDPRNDKLYFESGNGLRAIDCRYDTTVGFWEEGDGIRVMAWNAIDNHVYAAPRSTYILVFADDPTGVLEQPSKPLAVRRPCPTLVRGALDLRRRTPAVLLDITGREVMELQPGDNDVRHLSPGVYFVRPASSVERQASSVRKVILTR